MNDVLWVFGMALMCMLDSAAATPVQPGFDYRKVEGVWQRLGIVTKGEESVVLGNNIQISPLPKGNLDVQKSTGVKGTCRRVSFRFRHRDPPGRFIVLFPTGGQSTVHFVDTDYEGYLILHVETGDEVGLYLFARGFEAAGTLKGKFKTHAESLGFSEKDIYYPERAEQCPL